MDLYRSRLATYPRTSSSRLGQTPDGGPMRPALQSHVKYRNMRDVHKEIQEIPASFIGSSRSGVMEHSGAPDSIVGFQAVDDGYQTDGPLAFNELHAIPPSSTSPNRSFFMPRPALHGTGSMSEGTNIRLGQTRDLMPYGTSRTTGYEPRAQDSLHQHSAYSPDGAVNLRAVEDEHQINAPLASTELHAISPISTSPGRFFFMPPHGPFLDQQHGLLPSVGVMGSMSDGTDPRLGRPPQDLFRYGTFGPASNEPMVQEFPPQHSAYSEGQTSSSSSTRHDRSPPLITVPGRQNRVQCPKPGCIAVVNSENLTRHLNEVHKRKVKARCGYCGKRFLRPYLRDEHIRRAKCRSD